MCIIWLAGLQGYCVGQAAQIAIKQAAGDATLSVSPAEITIPQSGSAVSVNVTSNTSWTAA